MDTEYEKPRRDAQLGEDVLGQIAAALADFYAESYGERPADPHASLTGNLLAFVFAGGLSVADEWLLRIGKPVELREFREQFFEVVSERMVGVVGDLTGITVTSSFFGFDPQTRTTHAIFVLDLTELDGSEQRQAVLNWSEQVRRNARRLREEHVATRQVHRELKEQMRRKREELRPKSAEPKRGEPDGSGPASDDR